MRKEVCLVAAIVAASVLCCSAEAAVVIDAEPRRDGDGEDGGGGEAGSPVWQVLTKSNFSSQIRFHPHVLVMVTVPWSGESRSLMKETVRFLKSDKQLSGLLKLMVVFKNTDKVLADVLDAKEGITLLYYHLAKSFKYQGRLNAQKILSSVSHAISLQHTGFPFVFLGTAEEIENFFQSTDKGVLLLEFCGWSGRLLQAIYNGSRENYFSEESAQSGDFLPGILFHRKEKHKGLENEKLTCGINPWFEKLKVSSASEDTYRTTCTSDKFLQFESFFSELNKVVREFSLSPERQRFGVVSERSLMKFLSIGDPDGWQLLIHFSGFSSSPKILNDVDELKSSLQMRQSVVNEVDGDQRTQEGIFPIDRPSFILFIDRSSTSSTIKENSKSTLNIYRRIAHYYQIPNVDISAKVKVNEKMSYKISNQGQSISLSKFAIGNHENTLYNVIQQLIQQQKSAVKMREIKVSQLVKDVGFQLLSDDFNVELLDSQPASNGENSQLKNPIKKHIVDSNINFVMSTGFTEAKDAQKCEVPTIKYFLSVRELSQCQVVKGLALEKSVNPSTQNDVQFSLPESNNQAFKGSFFFSDGGYRLLRSLSSGKSKIPSLVIIDPAAQKHYILPEKTKLNFDSLVNFVDRFLNGSLVPHQRSEVSCQTPREYPKPPLLNMDFHEANGIPWVGANGFEEMMLGLHRGGSSECDGCDQVVLFTNSWCGFCHRMELVVREVYRAMKGFIQLLRSSPPANLSGFSTNGFPSIYRMDCTLNDCRSFLTKFGKGEYYPTLLLFPSKGTNAITYQGPASVLDFFDFLTEHSTNSHILNKYRGILWSRAEERESTEEPPSPTREEINTIISATADQETTAVVAVGSVLTATEKLTGAHPFENSTILIVHVRGGYQGLILNRQISWDVFDGLDLDLDAGPLMGFPLSHGGPVGIRDFPLVSLSREPLDGYVEVAAGIFYGDPFATGAAVGRIRWHRRPAVGLWFFFGYCSWSSSQLPGELADGAWQVGHMGADGLEWPRKLTSSTSLAR